MAHDSLLYQATEDATAWPTTMHTLPGMAHDHLPASYQSPHCTGVSHTLFFFNRPNFLLQPPCLLAVPGHAALLFHRLVLLRRF